MEERFIYYLIGVPVLGVLAQWIAWRLRLPSILLLLAFGIGLGEFFGLSPDEILAGLTESEQGTAVGPRLLFPFVTLAVAVVLFEGGLSLKLSELRETGGAVFRVTTLGVLIAWLTTTFAAKWFFGLHAFSVALMVGAVLVVTGPTVVAPLLRHIRPARNVGSLIKWEGIVVDPIGAILAVLVFQFAIEGEVGTGSSVRIAWALLNCTVVAGAIGAAAGWFLIQVMRRYWVPDYLHTVLFLVTALASFGLANAIHHESGLVTVTVLGIVLANQKQISIEHIVEFKEGLGVLLVSCLFILLGSRVEIARILDLGWDGVFFLLVLIVVIRPLSIWLSLWGTPLNWRERLFVGSLAPRGIVAAAVTAVFALKISALSAEDDSLRLLAEDAEKLVPITFLVIIGTVTVYGLAAAPLARLLGLADDRAQGVLLGGASPVAVAMAEPLKQAGFPVLLIDTNFQRCAAARMDGYRAECMSLLSERVYDDIDLSGIGNLLAITPNDGVNQLAVGELRHYFGRARVFRLARSSRSPVEVGNQEEHEEQELGRVLFHHEATHAAFLQRLNRGWIVKATKLSEEFGFEDFRELYGEDAWLLFVKDASENLLINTLDAPLKPKAGQTVIALVPPERDQG